MSDEKENEEIELPEIIVEPEGDTPEVIVSVDGNELEVPEKDQKDDIAELHARLEETKKREQEEREARTRAEREAKANKATAEHYQSAARDSQLSELTLYLSNLEAREESITEQRAVALSEGDYAREARLTKELQRTLVEKDRVQRGKETLERQEMPSVTQPANRTPTVEERTAHMPQPSRDWLRAHPEVIQDEIIWKKASALHDYAIDYMNIKADTPEYFEFLEDKLGYRKNTVDTSAETSLAGKKPTSSAAYAAPPSKNTPPSERLRTTPGAKVALSKDQLAFAKEQGYDPVEYAKGLRKAILAGAYDSRGA